MLRAEGIRKEFNDKVALSDINLTFPQKGLVIIKGESGSGKTTLLNLLTANDFPSGGKIVFNGVKITSKNAEEYRTQYCGNIYQDYMLIEDLSVKENIEIAMQVIGQEYSEEDIKALLKKVDLPEEYLDKKVIKLSGGEKQRVAIARAISKQNAMIFADEPTGNLDSKNGKIIMDLLKEISKERLVVVVSHNEKYNIEYADYTIKLVDGETEYEDLPKEEKEEERAENIFDKKSKYLKPKTMARLAYWGFEKNRIKTVLSIIAFVILCVLSCVSLSAYFSDLNLSLANSLDNSEKRNVMISVQFLTPQEEIQKFYESASDKPSLVYHFQDFLQGYILEDKYTTALPLKHAIVYDKEVGADVDWLYGTYPEKSNQIALSYSFACKMCEDFKDYTKFDVSELVGQKYKIYCDDYDYLEYDIVGIFDDGLTIYDFDIKELDESVHDYLFNRNSLFLACFIGKDGEKFMNYNSLYFDKTPGKLYQCKYGNINLYFAGYNEYADYVTKYPPLKKGEVYMGKTVADELNLKVGDTFDVSCFEKETFGIETTEEADKVLENLIIKDIFDTKETNYEILVNNDFFDEEILIDGHGKYNAVAFYYNAKDIKNSYAFFNRISKEGSNIWTEYPYNTLLTYAVVENTGLTHNFYEALHIYRYVIVIPLMCLSLIATIAIGFVSNAYLLSSKEKSLNILRSIGCGKKNISSILIFQLLTLVIIECALGFILAKLASWLLGKSLISLMLHISPSLDNELLLPLGWAPPLVIVFVSFAISALSIIIKVSYMFSKSIMENKTR